MTLRLAVPEEAETLWAIRNRAIRAGCRSSYAADVIARWTPDEMPERYRQMVMDHPFYVIDNADGVPVSTGYLDLSSHSVEAIFTVPEATGNGYAGRIIDALKQEARRRGMVKLTLSSTPNAEHFYQRLGFISVAENRYPSAMAGTDLRCIDMVIDIE